MSDIWRELPLSGRDRTDDVDVRPGWDAEIALVRARADDILTRHPDQDTAEAFVRASSPQRGLFARAFPPRVAPLRDLDRAVYAYLALCARVGAAPLIDARTSGAVALGRAAAAPTAIRAVISGHTLRATDAGWAFGRGPVLEATAVDMLAFLAGHSLTAPRAPRD